jgi:hypothetical protein
MAKIGSLRGRPRYQPDFEFVPLRLNVDDVDARLAVAGGLDVLAARQQQAADAGERIGHAHRPVERAHLGPDVQYGLPVVLELATGCNPDKGHFDRLFARKDTTDTKEAPWPFHVLVVLGGNSDVLVLHPRLYCNSHEIQRACQLRAHIRDPGGAPPFAIDTLLVEDGKTVIKGVEQLGEAEVPFGQDREFQRTRRLFDDVVEARLRRPGPTGRSRPRSILCGRRVERADDVALRQRLALAACEDVVRPHDRALQYGPLSPRSSGPPRCRTRSACRASISA